MNQNQKLFIQRMYWEHIVWLRIRIVHLWKNMLLLVPRYERNKHELISITIRNGTEMVTNKSIVIRVTA